MQFLDRSTGALAVLYAVLLLLVVIAPRIGLMPGVGEAFPGSPLFAHPYRVSLAASVVVLASFLGWLTARIGAGHGSWLVGLGLLVAGGVLSGLALETTPWILYPGDRYSAAFMWLMLGAPVGLLTWLAATWGLPRQGVEPVGA